MVAQHLSDQLLYVAVRSPPYDGSHEFDFDPDFAVWIDLTFHTQVYRAVPKAQVKTTICLSRFRQLSQLTRGVLPWICQQRRSRPKSLVQLFLIGFAEVEMLCTGKDQTPVSIRHGQVNVEAMRGRYYIRDGSHRGLC